MPVKRRLSKQREGAISDHAIALFEEMIKLGCSSPNPGYSCAVGDPHCECAGCQRWWELHRELRHATDGRLWLYPTISRWPPDRRRSWPDDSEQFRWLRLERAAKARWQRVTVTEPEPEPTAA